MTLLILAGVWALVFGHITITNSMRLKGNESRLFGALSILAAAYVMPYLTAYFNGVMPKLIASNEAFSSAYGLAIGAVVLFLTGWVTTQVLPKLRIPMVTVSVKRARS